MKTTLTASIDVNLLRELKVYCAMNDLKVSKYVSEAIKTSLEKDKQNVKEG